MDEAKHSDSQGNAASPPPSASNNTTASSSSSAAAPGSPTAPTAASTSSSSPSFFTPTASSSTAHDSTFHRVAVLLCPGCRYLEFPGCMIHNGLLCNIKGNGYMSCTDCETDRKAKGGSDLPGGSDNMLSMVCATDSAEPWSVACQHCNAVKAETIPWIIEDGQSVGLAASMELETEDVMPHSVIQCEQCKTSIFPLVNGRLTRRSKTDPSLSIVHPDEPLVPLTIDQFPFQHYLAGCAGKLVTIPILISKLEGKFCGQSLPHSPYLPRDSRMVPGFIPPSHWVTGEAHTQKQAREEHRKEKYVLAPLDHRTPVWRDKAYIGVFGDPFVRDTELEGGHIAESVDVMHFMLKTLTKGMEGKGEQEERKEEHVPHKLPDISTADWFSTFDSSPSSSSADNPARVALQRTISTIESSLHIIHLAKDALDALVDKELSDREKLQFTYRLMRHWRQTLNNMSVGEVRILPGGWIAPKAGHAIMHILFKHATSYSLVTCNTGGGVPYHPSSTSEDGNKMLFQTSVRIDDIPVERMEDDAWWLMFWRLQTVQSDDHDHHILYEVLLPTLAGKPLAEAIVPCGSGAGQDPAAAMRTPQRAGNCYLKCVLECIRYLQRAFGMSAAQTKQCSFNVRRLFVQLVHRDLHAHERELVDYPYPGDDSTRQRRKVRKLQQQMKEEGVPHRKLKRGELMSLEDAAIAQPDSESVSAPKNVDNPTAPSMVRGGGVATSHPVADGTQEEADSYPLITLPAEPLTTDSTPLHDESDLTMIRLSTKQVAHAAIKESKAGRMDAEQLRRVWEEIAAVERVIEHMPIHVHSTADMPPPLDMGKLEEEAFSLGSPRAGAGAQKEEEEKKESAVDSDEKQQASPPPSATSSSPYLFDGFDSFPLLLDPSTTEKLDTLAGVASHAPPRTPVDFTSLHSVCHTLDDILVTLERCVKLCEAVGAPMGDSLNGYYQVQTVIQEVVSRCIALPGGSLPHANAWYTRGMTSAEQCTLIKHLWQLGQHYISAEFSIESPAFVSGMERTVVMWTLITLADWVVRRTPTDRGGGEQGEGGMKPVSPLTQVLNSAEGRTPFYSLDMHNGSGVHVRDMVASMQCSHPHLALLYGDLVEYWMELETTPKVAGLELKHIFPFTNSPAHQTAMLTDKSATMDFMRDVARIGEYTLERRGYGGKECSEVEVLARWLFAMQEGDYSVGASFGSLIPQFARDHPEYTQYRDLHFLFKLALTHTHPTCRVVKPGRYTAKKDAMIYWSVQGMPMSNSMVMLFAKAFDKKEMILIRTRALESAANLSTYLPASAKGAASSQAQQGFGGLGGLGGLMGAFGGGGGGGANPFGGLLGGLGGGMMGGGNNTNSKAEWSEEDVIHTPTPTLFHNLLTTESSERLLSLLTAPYIRVPLILSFFSHKDRVDLLSHRTLQRLVEAVLFENGAWASRMHEEHIDLIPIQAEGESSGSAASQQADEDQVGRASRLGSPYGLLLNELCHAASASLTPFLSLVCHTLSLDTANFTPQSATIKLMLFVARLAARMERFMRETIHLIQLGALHSSCDRNTTTLLQAHTDLLYLLHGPMRSVLLTYKDQVVARPNTDISDATWLMGTIVLVSATAMDVPEYVKQTQPSRELEDTLSSFSLRFDPTIVSSLPSDRLVELLGSFSFTMTWHSMGIGIGKDLAEDEREGERNKPTLDPNAAGGDLLSQLAETMQQSMNASKLKAKRATDPAELEKASKPPLPERELFTVLHQVRPHILAWVQQQQEAGSDASMLPRVCEGIVEWVHGHKMAKNNGDEKEAEHGSKNGQFNPQMVAKKPQPASDSSSSSSPSVWHPFPTSPGRFLSPTQRLELDFQSAHLTFYDHDVFPVHDLIARHEDFISVFGSAPQHYALVDDKVHRQTYAIFGSSYQIEWWDASGAEQGINVPMTASTTSKYNLYAPTDVMRGEEQKSSSSSSSEGTWPCGSKGCKHANPYTHQRCERCGAFQPLLSSTEKFGILVHGLPFTRRYGSTYLAPEEQWIVDLLEPLLRSVFGPDRDTLNYSLWMREEPWTDKEDKVCLMALDGSTFKMILAHRHTQLLEVYNLIEMGRVLYRSLVYTSNQRLSLAGLSMEEANAENIRMAPWGLVDRFENGTWEEVQKSSMSFTLTRIRHLTATMSVKERFISPSLLTGLVPKVLLEHYQFYLVQAVEQRAQQQDGAVGEQDQTPSSSSSSYAWLGSGDMLGFLKPEYAGQTQWNFELHVRLLPRSASDQDSQDTVWDSHHALISQIHRGAAGGTNDKAMSIEPGSTLPEYLPTPTISPSPSPSPSPFSSPIPAAVSLSSSSSPYPFKSLILLNLRHAAPDSFLARLTALLVRLDDLSHVLVWARPDDKVQDMRDRRKEKNGESMDSFKLDTSSAAGSSADSSYRITRIELPRLKLSFSPRRMTHPDGRMEWRLYSNDHAGFFLSDLAAAPTESEGQKDTPLCKLLHGIPNSVLLENARRELWLLVPNPPLARPQVLSCPFSTELVSLRSDPTWLKVMDTRAFVYPIHVSHTFLHSNTLVSTLYLLVLSLLSRQYELCARYASTCEIDTALSAEERFVFNMVQRTLHDNHPDAHAVRLKLFVCIWLSGEKVGWETEQGEPWDLEEEYANYLRKNMHVSAACRLSEEEEELVYQQIVHENAQKKDTAPNLLQNRAAVREAIKKHVAQRGSGAAAGTSSSSPTDSPPRTPLMFKPPKRDGLSTIWWDWQSQLPSYLSKPWSPGLWGGMVVYDRPSDLDHRDIDLLETIGEALHDSLTGSVHRMGFMWWMDLILGGAGPVKLDSTDPECEDVSFSLGRLLAQCHFLKLTEYGKKMQPQPHYLPYAAAAVFGSGFIPTPNNTKWRRAVTSIPAFPPLPQVPWQGREEAMRAGSLLHKQGTPVNQLLVLLAQWSAGFVQMCKEWQAERQRPAVAGESLKQGYALLLSDPSGTPSNTSCSLREVHPFDAKESDHCVLDADEVHELAMDPLASINMDEFLVATAKTADSSSSTASTDASSSGLPFDVSSRPAAHSFVAKGMLKRMATDMKHYQEQMRKQVRHQLRGMTTESLRQITLTAEGDGMVKEAMVKLKKLYTLLQELRAKDWEQVQRLQQDIELKANRVPGVTSMEGKEAGQKDGSTPSLPNLQYVLSRYAGQSFTLRLDYLTALLLSSTPDKDLLSVNPHLEPSSIHSILLHVSTLLLRTTRVGLVDRLLYEVEEMRGLVHMLDRKARAVRALRPTTLLARSLSGGTTLECMDPEVAAAHSAQPSPEMAEVDEASMRAATELAEMAQQIAVQSTTLASNLLTARHYMRRSDSADAAHPSVYHFDPRYLVFEYIFNILLRKMQVELISSFASAAKDKKSLVQQMIMGAGKTTVVGPLLALMLADGQQLVTMVVPSALLPMSRSVLRARFSSLLPKRIHTLHYDRSTPDDPRLATKVLYKISMARSHAGVVIATSTSIKSLLLKFLELHVALQTAEYGHMTPVEAQSLQSKSLVIDCLGQIMSHWRQGLVILDEIDLLLHPLKSELNFPCGAKVALQPAPSRWGYTMHLLDAFFYQRTGFLSIPAFHELAEAQKVLKQLQQVLQEGAEQHLLQTRPHLILLNLDFYHQRLKPLLALWSLLWLKAHGGVSAGIPDAILLEYLTHGWRRSEVEQAVSTLLSKTQIELLNLAQSWLSSYLPHVLAKINRVGYGLLKEEEMEGESMSLSRRLVAVPFVAKDVPSRSSEFASPETVVGLTILAYRIEGLRRRDLVQVVSVLKNSLAQELGPEHMRPSAKRFAAFVAQAKRLNPALSTLKVLPLPHFSLSDPLQVDGLYSLLRVEPATLHHWLTSYLFPTVMNHQVYNLSASGQELGNGMLFSCTLGFSGTPSSLLPLELGDCVYEKGTDGRVLSTLTSSAVVSYEVVPRGWDVQSLLRQIARASNSPFHSLIDTGALITGMTNHEVAEFLLAEGLHGMDGVVYLDHNDQAMILLRSHPTPLPLSQSGIAPSKRFSFFDQIHTTGIDLHHVPHARAALTLGKDMVFRDLAQGAFRMRQIGQGQKIHMLVIPEVLTLIERELGLGEKQQQLAATDAPSSHSLSSTLSNSKLLAQLPTHVSAWLTLNSMRMEQLQFLQLCTQNLHAVWRKKAFNSLLSDALKPSVGALASRRHLRFDLNASNLHPDIFWLVECINLFKVAIDFRIPDHVPEAKPFFASLKTLISQHTTFIREDEQCMAIGTVLTQALEAATQVLPTNAFDKEMITEQEREQEQEKQQEILRDPRAERGEEQHTPWKVDLLRSAAPLHLPPNEPLISSHQVTNTTSVHPFYPLASFSLEGRPLPLTLPRSLLMSHNFFKQRWALNPRGHRRLKNIYVVLEWCEPREGEQEEKSLPPPALTPSQQQRWAQVFRLLDVNNDGQLSTPEELEGVCRVLSIMLDEEVPAAKVEAQAPFNQEKLQQLFQSVTQRMHKDAGEKEERLLPSSPTSESAHRFFVILPLSEAQSLRRTVHTAHPLYRDQTNKGGVQWALWSLEGQLLETTPFYNPSSTSHAVSVSLQTARFFNGDLFYSSPELVSLLRGLGATHPAHRRTLIEQLLLCRHRDQRQVASTPLEMGLQLEDEAHFLTLHTLRVAIHSRIAAKGLSLLQAFHAFDLNGDGRLEADELWTACHALGLIRTESDESTSSSSCVTPSDILDLIRFAVGSGEEGSGQQQPQRQQQQQLDFNQWARALRMREEEEEEAVIAHSRAQVEVLEEKKEEIESSAATSSAGSSTQATSAALPQLRLIRMPAPPAPPPPPVYVPPTQQAVPLQASIAARRVAPSAVPSFPPAAAAAPAPARPPPSSSSLSSFSCSLCTYINPAGRTRCEMCDTPRP